MGISAAAWAPDATACTHMHTHATKKNHDNKDFICQALALSLGERQLVDSRHSGSVAGVGWNPHTRPERREEMSPSPPSKEVPPWTDDLLLPPDFTSPDT